jgi:Outer membrane protein beta-barrel domain
MKKILLTTLTAFAAFTTHAQLQLGILADYHYSYLYNKSDVAADASLDYVSTYKPSFGLHVGYAIKPKIILVAEPQYYAAGQQFVGNPPLIGLAIKSSTIINLSYLQLPIYLQYQFGNNTKGVKQVVQLGGFVSSLVGYHYQYKETLFNGLNNKDYEEITDFNKDNQVNNNVNYFGFAGNDSIQSVLFNGNASLFKKLDYGLHLGYGISIPINKNINLGADIYAKYGFAQVDNLDTITYIKSDGSFTVKRNIQDTYYCRDNSINPSSTLRNPKSNNIFAGLLLRLVYTFPSKKSIQ